MSHSFTPSDLTITVPCKDAQATVGTTLNSMRPHMKDGGKCILIDDGSTDKTLSILKAFAEEWPGAEVISLDEGKGAGNARNLGISKTDTALWGTLDADDWVHRDYYQTQIKLFNRIDDLDFVRTGFIEVKGPERTIRTAPFGVWNKPFDPKLGIMPEDRSTLVDQDQSWSGLYSTDFLKKNGIMYDNLATCEDKILCWKIQVLGRKMAVSPECRIFYRRGNVNSLTQIGDMRQLDFLESMKNIYNFLLDQGHQELFPKLIRRILSLICFHIGKKDRLQPEVKEELIRKSSCLLNLLPQTEIEEALSRIDKKRRDLIKGIM
ncbi:glycosyl transferase [Pseudovibrio japonicus]|uniref:Glycosyl transferase n=1 Tax=Pseudovibrio japonicus TaxID=366534 RepID=A0ABQ3ED93_9HYPH|nr:glycosyltransferase [Pseudovibrio japonicus]GHB31138.1 glycosyl transferase [Pseudovibrio japonicus]